VHDYRVYILASPSRTLYIGFTSDLLGRLWKHKHGVYPGFTKRFNITSLVYFESTSDPHAAITREKQLKRWPRWRKVRLIERENPDWRDLSLDWFRGDSPVKL
jgi:putative endonuclease